MIVQTIPSDRRRSDPMPGADWQHLKKNSGGGRHLLRSWKRIFQRGSIWSDPSSPDWTEVTDDHELSDDEARKRTLCGTYESPHRSIRSPCSRHLEPVKSRTFPSRDFPAMHSRGQYSVTTDPNNTQVVRQKQESFAQLDISAIQQSERRRVCGTMRRSFEDAENPPLAGGPRSSTLMHKKIKDTTYQEWLQSNEEEIEICLCKSDESMCLGPSESTELDYDGMDEAKEGMFLSFAQLGLVLPQSDISYDALPTHSKSNCETKKAKGDCVALGENIKPTCTHEPITGFLGTRKSSLPEQESKSGLADSTSSITRDDQCLFSANRPVSEIDYVPAIECSDDDSISTISVSLVSAANYLSDQDGIGAIRNVLATSLTGLSKDVTQSTGMFGNHKGQINGTCTDDNYPIYKIEAPGVSKNVSKAEPRKMIPLSEKKPKRDTVASYVGIASMKCKSTNFYGSQGLEYDRENKLLCNLSTAEDIVPAEEHSAGLNQSSLSFLQSRGVPPFTKVSTSKIPYPQNDSRLPLPYQYLDEYGFIVTPSSYEDPPLPNKDLNISTADGPSHLVHNVDADLSLSLKNEEHFICDQHRLLPSQHTTPPMSSSGFDCMLLSLSTPLYPVKKLPAAESLSNELTSMPESVSAESAPTQNLSQSVPAIMLGWCNRSFLGTE
ncbi:predicted protein [Phaeodactylum tricornutum CCAP 1055/1]|uniref:Uncharacterized protein n=1 Tax=Phaeodactylum tricornutum (strain CCAP 1055/1) TaxID=556484 RepID=B7G5Q9_PHATC|nr:predicted protein [Phaeodactylum tricornutum CCAP 1055/1]EEC46197.1 predicted protein [Phaeodactylum tricornutum CCAP 1055/1]|eukprot:XP_002182296.1 predicted protein [Phaeodactylum tricornutum CCAP 1055/1]